MKKQTELEKMSERIRTASQKGHLNNDIGILVKNFNYWRIADFKKRKKLNMNEKIAYTLLKEMLHTTEELINQIEERAEKLNIDLTVTEDEQKWLGMNKW